MISRYRLSARDFSALAAGYGGGDAVHLLQSGQLSKHLLLIRSFAKTEPAAHAELEPALSVLAQAQRRDPAAAARILSDPWLGAWAASCARRLYRSGTGSAPLWAELAHLRAVAAAAAVRTGVDADLMLCVRGGRVPFPTLGSAVIDAPDHTLLHVRVRGGRATLHGAGGGERVPRSPDDQGWQNLRRLEATCDGLRIRVTLDDLDPYRNCFGMTLADRVSTARLADWRRRFADAWQLLVRHLPVRAEELAAGLRALVPLAETSESPVVSATTRDAFGGFVLSLPASAAELAATMVHEFQHSKLSGLLDLVPLHDASTEARFFAPWRRDPRTVGGLLHGTYAFLGVADVWRRLRAVRVAPPAAEQELANLREQVSHGLATLARSGALTVSGTRFVEGMRPTVERLMAERLSAGAVATSRRILLRNEVSWRLRNLRPDPDQVANLTAAYLAAAPQPARAEAGAEATDDAFVHAAQSSVDNNGTHAALVRRPELVRAVYHEVAAQTGTPPDLMALSAWLTSTNAA